MRVYIAGPVSGKVDGNLEAFTRAESALTEAGFDVTNPRLNGNEGEKTWLDYMRVSLQQIAQVDGIAYLDDWEHSRGAKIEVEVGKALGLRVQHWTDWLYVE